MNKLLERLDALQQRHRAAALPIATFKRFGEHGGGRLASTISYWSFFSVFPLLLAFVTVLNIVLEGRPDTRRDLLDGALGQVPVIGRQLADTTALGGSPLTVTVGVIGAIWTGMAAASALQWALEEVWDIPMHDRPNGLVQRVRSLSFLVVFAVGMAVSALASNVVAILDVGPLVAVSGMVVTFLANVAILLLAFRILMSGRQTVRQMLPGAVASAVVLVVLLQLGSFVVQRYINGASDTYGTFAVVIALLSWFYLVSRVILLGAELNGVLAHRLSPRSLVPGSGVNAADQRAAERDAQRVVRDERIVETPTADDRVDGRSSVDDDSPFT